MNKREKIKKELLDQLKSKGNQNSYFEDLIDIYMGLWDTVQELTEEIEERGVMVEYQNGENQWGVKKNDSVAERNKTVNQMLKVLNELGIKPVEKKGDTQPPKL